MFVLCHDSDPEVMATQREKRDLNAATLPAIIGHARCIASAHR